MDVKNAVDTAVDSCIADGIMKDFLIKHKAEVMSVCLTEFDEKVYTEGIREEGREEGLDRGLRALVCSLRDFLPDFESVYKAVVKNEEYANVPKGQVEKYY